MRYGSGGMLGSVIGGAKRMWQLLFLVQPVPTLPEMSLHEVFLLDPEELHEHIFRYLIKYCEPRQAEELKRSIPIYVNA